MEAAGDMGGEYAGVYGRGTVKRLLPLVLLFTACANAGTPTLDPRAAGAYFNELAKADAEATAAKYAAALITQDANEHALNQARTATAFPLELTATGQAIALQDIAITQAWDNSTAEAAVRATADARNAIAIPTSAAATGTALAVSAQKDKAKLESARALSNLIGLFALGFIVGMGIGCYWLLGRARADIKRRNNLADNNKPQVFGNLVIYPNGKGGYVHQSIIVGRATLPELEAPEPDSVPRFIKRNGAGVSSPVQVLDVVSDLEHDWRECCVDALLEFERAGTFASTGLCGDGKPFASATHWMRVTNTLRDNNLILKENGGKTLLALPTYADAIAYVQTARDFHFPDLTPPKVRKSL